jgi:hypothetical protein
LVSVAPESDFATFFWMTQEIAIGHWPSDSYGWVWAGPGYPLLLAPLLALGGGLTAIWAANVLFQLAMVLGVWVLSRRLFGPRAAVASAIFAAILPDLWLYTPLVAAENLAMLLLTLIVLLGGFKRPWAALMIGVTAVALALTRPAYLFLVPLIVIVAWGSHRWSFRQVRWYLTGVLIILAPIILANWLGGGPVLPGGAAGWQLWLVHNERATGRWFPAQDADDYPFKGMEENGRSLTEISAAQRKLAIQFMIANPSQTLSSYLHRHQDTWAGRPTALDFTMQPSAPNLRFFHSWVDKFARFSDGVYTSVIALAGITAMRFRKHLDLLPVVLPLAYVLAIYALAEGNSRYRIVVLPLVCVLAGAVVGSRNLLFWLLPVLALVWLGPSTLAVAAWLIFVITLAPLAELACRHLALLRAQLARAQHRHPWKLLATTALLAVAIGLAGVGLKRAADQILIELAAVAPEGWQGYETSPEEVSKTVPLAVRDSNTPPDMREVSYPDAVVLQFTNNPPPGGTMGLVRTLPELIPGQSYQFYLQLYDPGSDGDPGGALVLTLNDQIVWQREQGQAEGAKWHYLVLPWIADAPTATIRVERTGGHSSRANNKMSPMVRTLHLYPKY